MNSPSTKTIRLLLKLLASPKRLTKVQLAAFLGLKDRSSVTDHINHIRAAGIVVEHDEHYKYYVLPNTGFKELRYLAPLTEEDKRKIKHALGQYSTAEALQLNNKIDSLLDLQKLGIEALRRPELEKLDALEEAKKEKKCVLLINYRSRSSNVERDRKVEVFSIEPELGMLKAYDREKLRVSFFMLSRMDRVQVITEDWKFEQMHYNQASDAFNIVDNNQSLVDLTLRVSAFNDLVERNPKARQHVRKGAEENTYEFSAKVNHKFIGLRQFIFANWKDVVINGPEDLRQQMVREAEEMWRRLGGG